MKITRTLKNKLAEQQIEYIRHNVEADKLNLVDIPQLEVEKIWDMRCDGLTFYEISSMTGFPAMSIFFHNYQLPTL